MEWRDEENNADHVSLPPVRRERRVSLARFRAASAEVRLATAGRRAADDAMGADRSALDGRRSRIRGRASRAISLGSAATIAPAGAICGLAAACVVGVQTDVR